MGSVEATHKIDYDTTPDHSGIEWQVSQFDSGEPGSGPYGADPHLQSYSKEWKYGAGTGPAKSGTGEQ